MKLKIIKWWTHWSLFKIGIVGTMIWFLTMLILVHASQSLFVQQVHLQRLQKKTVLMNRHNRNLKQQIDQLKTDDRLKAIAQQNGLTLNPKNIKSIN